MTDEVSGSNWYFAVMEGLAAPKHCEQMGPAVWGYLALLRIADFQTGEITLVGRALVQYLQDQLGLKRPTAYRWVKRLSDTGYIYQNEETTTITKYQSAVIFGGVSKMRNPSQKWTSPNGLSPIEWTPSIQYKDLRYRTLKGFFEALLNIINQASNPIAELRQFWAFVWGPDELPDFGRLGKAAKRAGNGRSRPGCRVLALQSVVAAVGRRVVGNPIDYVERMAKGNGNGRNAQSRGGRGGVPAADEWEAPNHGDWGFAIEAADNQGDTLPGRP